MRVKNDIVIDIETMGTDDDARIVSIGALIFNPAGDVEKDSLPRLEIFLDHGSQVNRRVDPGTMVWWEKTAGEEARKRAFSTDVTRVSLEDALAQLCAFYRKHTPNNSWACAPDFDMGILENAYKSIGENFPTQFWRYRDVRTIEDFVFKGNQRKPGGVAYVGGVAHDALDDCIMEAKVVQLAYKKLHK
tara:strand:- start:210 stop:776 length:567 start_codon:yes stop_codon:yes gene_type:complete